MPTARIAPTLGVLALLSCATSPASRAPLRDQLAAADTSRIEDATRACLTDAGWKVDPIAEDVFGARRVGGSRGVQSVEVYIYPPTERPRITGGPDWTRDPYWTCLSEELAGTRAARAAVDEAEPRYGRDPDEVGADAGAAPAPRDAKGAKDAVEAKETSDAGRADAR
jgi:hypothetical protein